MTPPTKPYRVALMARVSTPKQGEKPMSLPDQYAECHKYAAAHGWEVVAELEDKYTGMRADRPGILTAIDLATNGQIDGVLASTHDRLCRSMKVRGWFETELEKRNARIHYASMPDVPATPLVKASGGMQEVFAELMRDTAVGNMAKGRIARVYDGDIIHNGVAPLGYKFNADRTGYLEDPDEAWWVVEIFKKYANGWSPQRIADWLSDEPGAPEPRKADRWARSTIVKLLAREDYTGTGYRLGYEIPTDEHGRPLVKYAVRDKDQAVKMDFPKLVEPELWRRVEMMRTEAKHRTEINKARADPDGALLQGTGRIKCLSCGGTMSFESREYRGPGRGLYRCHRKSCTDRMSFSQPRIDWLTVGVVRDMVMNEMWLEDRYTASLEAGGSLDQEIDRATKAVEDLAKKRKGYLRRIDEAIDDDGLYGSLKEQFKTVQAQLMAAQEREKDLLTERARATENTRQLRDFGEWLAEHREGFEWLDMTGMRRMVALVFVQVRVGRTKSGRVKAQDESHINTTPQVGSPFYLPPRPGEVFNDEALKRVAFDTSPHGSAAQREQSFWIRYDDGFRGCHIRLELAGNDQNNR